MYVFDDYSFLEKTNAPRPAAGASIVTVYRRQLVCPVCTMRDDIASSALCVLLLCVVVCLQGTVPMVNRGRPARMILIHQSWRVCARIVHLCSP